MKIKHTNILIALLCFLLCIMAIGVYMMFFGVSDTQGIMSVTENQNGVVTRSGVIDGIPVLEYTNGSDTKKPVVILLHGMGGNKTSFDAMAMHLAQHGMMVICFDGYGHGERTTDIGMSAVEVAVETGNDINTILNYYENIDTADVSTLALGGVSMGGFSAYYHTANGEYTPDAVYTMLATPAFEDLIGTDIAYTFYKNGSTQEIVDIISKDEVDIFLKNSSPFETLLETHGVEYAIVMGSEDDVVPYQGAEHFAQLIQENGTDIIEYRTVQGMQHEVTQQEFSKMQDFFVDWFKKG